MRTLLYNQSIFRIVSFIWLCLFLMGLCFPFGCRRSGSDNAEADSQGWTLRDCVSANLTGFDPIQIVDATTLNVLANCYEGLVVFDADGNIGPGLAERWESSKDQLEWTFHLKSGVKFHPWGEIQGFQHTGQLSARDAVYSLTRAITSPASFNGWWLGDIVARRDAGTPDIWATDPLTIRIRLKQPFALLNRLVSVAGWIYPENIDQVLGERGLAGVVVGTGPYRLSMSIPDDQVTLARWDDYHAGISVESPATVVIYVMSDRIAALEAFRANKLDVLELDLDTLSSGRALAGKRNAQLVPITANHLDYFCMNLEHPPFNNPDLRMALSMSIDREKLSGLFQGLAIPAYGFTPPTNPAYRGEDAIRAAGFRYDPVEARRLFESSVDKTEQKKHPLSLKLVYDGETMPELATQFFKDSVEKVLPLTIQLEKVTWPELMQQSFEGNLSFHRLWWLIATPSEDVYYQFYMPGKAPPKGLNISRYSNAEFAKRYDEVFAETSREVRLSGMKELESQLIRDAVAIPLWHKNAEFLIRRGLRLPIGTTLKRFYSASKRTGEKQ